MIFFFLFALSALLFVLGLWCLLFDVLFDNYAIAETGFRLLLTGLVISVTTLLLAGLVALAALV